VYYVSKGDEFVREVCKTGDGDWTVGTLLVKGNTYQVRPGTSISASVHYYKDKNDYNLRVFASKEGTNNKGVSQISAFKFMSDESGIKSWQGNFITEAVARY
jgi:hypothetical protein